MSRSVLEYGCPVPVALPEFHWADHRRVYRFGISGGGPIRAPRTILGTSWLVATTVQVVALGLLAGEARAVPVDCPGTIDPTKQNVLVVPGIMGSLSELMVCGNSQQTVDLKHCVLKRDSSLELPPSAWVINPGGKVYDELIAKLEEDFNTIPVPYDWRRPIPDIAVDYLKPCVDDAVAAGVTVDIVAHSMGGLVVRELIQSEGGAGVHRVAFLGTPHRGSTDVFPVWEAGNAGGLGSRSVRVFIKCAIKNGKEGCSCTDISNAKFVREGCAAKPMTKMDGVRQLLPVFDYFRHAKDGPLQPYAEMCESNEYLPALNANAAALTTSGVEFRIYAGKDRKTVQSFRRKKEPTPGCVDEEYPDGKGKQENKKAKEEPLGDGRVLYAESACPKDFIPAFQGIPCLAEDLENDSGKKPKKGKKLKHGDLPTIFKEEVVAYLLEPPPTTTTTTSTTSTTVPSSSVLAADLVYPSGLTLHGGYVYVGVGDQCTTSSTGNITRVSIDGSTQEQVGQVALSVRGMAFAAADFYVASDCGGGGGYISRVDLSTGQATVLTTANQPRAGVAIDETYAYFGECNAGPTHLRKVSLSGGTPTNLASRVCRFHLAGPWLFYVVNGALVRKEKDGTGLLELATSVAPIQMTSTAGTLYWTEADGVYAVPFEGGAAASVVSDTLSGHIATDGTRLYWSYYNEGASGGGIRSSMLDGSDVTTVVDSVELPSGFAVDANAIYWTELVSGGVTSVLKKSMK